MTKISTLNLLVANLARSLQLPKFQLSTWKMYTIAPMSRGHITAIRNLYAEPNNGNVSMFNRAVLLLCGGRLCLVAIANNGDVAGFEHFYFNRRDLAENTVHEGYVAVAPRHAGNGLASQMRRHSLNHFARAGLQGITTRIDHDNKASLVSARNVGFEVVEDYVEAGSGEKRYYMLARATPQET